MTDLPAHLCDATLAQISSALHSRKTSAREVTEAMIGRLKSRGVPLNAVAGMDEEGALTAAETADDGDLTGTFAGVPMAHKDMFYRPGRISACGSKIRADFVPDVLSTVLQRLDVAGALDIARLNMVEFAFGVSGHNEITGDVRNPWNTDHITGGSSSGSGAAVAARATFAALGSDTGGSVRVPAACCGVVGMKVTMGRVSRYGAMPLSHSLDTIGPLTRTVRDNAMMLQVIAGYDPKDPSSANVAVEDYVAGLELGVKGLRIGVPTTYFLDGITDELRDRYQAVVDVLRSLGAEIKELAMPDDIAMTNDLTGLISATEGAALHQNWLEERGDDYGVQTFKRFAAGLATPATRYIQAKNLRTEMLARFNAAVFDHVDLLLTPMMILEVPTLLEADANADPAANEVLTQARHCSRPINFLGLPGLSIPTGLTKRGLPSSVQLVGRPFDEATLYRAARAYERETMWVDQAPNCKEWEVT